MTDRCRVFLAALVLASACKTPGGASPAATPIPATRPAGPIHLTVVGTNDIHGWVYPHETKVGPGLMAAEGGVASFAGYLAILRAANPGGVVLLDAGDLFQGTLVSNLSEGAVVIDAYNALGYRATAIGNHEFDYGPLGPGSTSAAGQDPFGALKQRIRQAKFPLLAANIYEAESGDRPSWLGNDGTALLDVQGLRVGLVGVVTPATPRTTNPVNVGTLRFGSLAPEALEGAKRLRARGAELVLGVVHGGGRCASWADPHDLSSCDLRNGEVFEMLNALPPKTLDAVVAGDTHSGIGHFVQGTPVIETYGLGRYFGTIDLYVDPATHKVLDGQTSIHPMIPICPEVDEATQACDPKALKDKPVKWVAPTFLGQKVVRDEAIAALLKPALDRVAVEQSRKLGVSVPKTLWRNYEAESALGSFLADSLREMEGADVALLNSGGLRADLAAGELTYGSTFEVIPFDNTVATVTVTGDELKRLLQAAYGARKGVFQESGLKVRLSPCPGADRLKGVTLPDGKAVEPLRQYRVVLPDFLARGGDGLGPVMSTLPGNRVDLGEERPLNFRDALVAFWQKRKGDLVAPPLGRVTVVDDGEKCVNKGNEQPGK